MGILSRGYDELVMSFTVPATQVADLHVAAERLPAGPGWWLKDIRAKLLVAGITGAQAVDINIALVTLLGSTKVSFATTAVDPTYPTLGVVKADGGDLISMDTDTIHSGTAAEGLVVELVWTRIPQAGVTNTGPE